ncbi:hypothetical protein B8W99_17935 [Peribacillus simplex]|nr:hypothetical protein B8W99_17935 [Peribacillus simplex]
MGEPAGAPRRLPPARGKRVPGGEIKSTPNNISWFRVRPFRATFYTKRFHLNFCIQVDWNGRYETPAGKAWHGRTRRRAEEAPTRPRKASAWRGNQVHT